MYTLLEMGNSLLLTEITKANRHKRIKKLNKTFYKDLTTGKIKKFTYKAKSRKSNNKSLYRSFANLRILINAYCYEPQNVLWVTLTYAENMTDTKQLKKDFSNFWKRFVYYCMKQNIPEPQYISVVEPQARGAWHWHCLFIFSKKRPFIANDKMAEIWKHGFTKTKAVKATDNIAGYLCAYLADLPLDEITGDEKDKHKIEKGARLALYPPGMHIYRHSKGIALPVKYEITEEQAEIIRSTYELSYKTEKDYKDPATDYETKIIKEWYQL